MKCARSKQPCRSTLYRDERHATLVCRFSVVLNLLFNLSSRARNSVAGMMIAAIRCAGRHLDMELAVKLALVLLSRPNAMQLASR